METFVQTLIALIIVAICLALYRLFRGPTVIDRLLAFDGIATCSVGILALLSLLWETDIYVELILVYSLLGFVSTVGLVLYLHRTIPVRNPGDKEPPKGHS